MARSIKRTVAAALAVCALCASVSAAPAGSPVDKHGALSVQNGRIVNQDGEPVALRGMSFFWSTPSWEGSRFYTEGTVNWLTSDWNVDIVRAAMDPNNRGNWKDVVNAAIAKGIYVIIDWHSHNPNTNDAKTFFTGVANDYKTTPNVIFEIYNEPCAGSGCAGDNWATQIKPYATEVVGAIRNAGSQNIIIIGTGDYSKRVDQAAESPVSGTNLVYAVHFYTAEPGTQHQGDLRSWCSVAMNKGLALFVSEFGLSEADGGGKDSKQCPTGGPSKQCPSGSGTYSNKNIIDTVEARTWFKYLDEYHIGWANWSIVDKDEAASALRSGASATGSWSASNLSPSGAFIREALRTYATQTRTVTITQTGEGTVTRSPDGTAYKYGTPVTLTATPAAGWKFDGWSGGASGTAAKVTLSPLYTNISVTANFTQGSMINYGSFTNNITGWTSLSVTLAHDAANGALKAAVNTGGSSSTRVQTSASDGNQFTMEANAEYTLSFRARTESGSRQITARITNSGRTINYMDTAAVTLGTSWETFTKTFTTPSSLNGAASDASAILLFACGSYPNDAWTWYLDDVILNKKGGSTPVLPIAQTRLPRTAWNITKTGGALHLRGPVETNAVLSLYNVRGKMVKSVAARDGLALNAAGIPAGSYIAVVKNKAGKEVYRERFSFAR